MKNYLVIIFFLMSVLLLTTSCEDYLDKPPVTDLTVEEVFKNFTNAQGFVEEMYAYVVDYGAGAHWQTNISYGEDAYGLGGYFNSAVDRGQYRQWMPWDNGSIFGTRKRLDTSAELAFNRHRIWNSSWLGIRKANIVIENAEKLMVDATPLERQAILGQAYFFRGFFHHEIMKYWGTIPFIDKVLGDDWQLPRPATWKETALLVNEDLKKAAELLPVDWDDWGEPGEPGNRTRGNNRFRITKGAAYSILAKNYLFAASPLMKGGTNTYDYDVELAREAVKYFAEVIKLKDSSGNPRYDLEPWETYDNVFYVLSGPYPGGKEFIFSQSGGENWVHFFFAYTWQPGTHCAETAMVNPTHNYLHNYFGMSDGLACDDSPLYDPENPWENRDPRFNKWIVVDGDPMIKNMGAATGNNEKHRYAQFYQGGVHRFPANNLGTYTGYLTRKWFNIENNTWDNKGVSAFRLHVRFTDVLLMYAEAALVAYGIDVKPEFLDLSALDAINKIRERAGAASVHPNYRVSNEKFMDEIRRERAVEMAWEGHRWMDVRRWRLGTELKYKLKTELLFDRDDQGKPVNFREQVLVTRVFDEKHYWLPFPEGEVLLYEGFPQNPGW
jgi:starch-binding outer membrane protein, SusD/RagB family